MTDSQTLVAEYVRTGSEPAFRELVGDAAVGTVARRPGDWLAALPVTTKRSYVDRFPLAGRCTGGAVPRSGRPF